MAVHTTTTQQLHMSSRSIATVSHSVYEYHETNLPLHGALMLLPLHDRTPLPSSLRATTQTHAPQPARAMSEVPLHRDFMSVPRCSSPTGPIQFAGDIIISIVQEQWCLTPSKPSQPCSNNGNAKLQLCMQWITRPEDTMSEIETMRVN